MPENMKVQSQFTVNNIADTVAHLTMDDVRPRGEVELPSKGGVTALLETFDGLRVILNTTKKDDRHYATVSAEFDLELIQKPEEPSETKEAKKEGAEQEGKEKATPEVPAPTRLKSSEEVQQEVEQLNERLSGWVYVIPSFRAEAITKRRSDLITRET